ncbi:MAG: c-type cytochrome [Sneathiellales bacterium]|nr:c-type cytochrome [Sneathiellales bacterium]
MKKTELAKWISLCVVAGLISVDFNLVRARPDLSKKDQERVEKVVKPTTDFSKAEAFEVMSGGATTTTRKPDGDAFSQFSANMDFEGQERFKLGNALFRKLWVSSPSSTKASDGLGPFYNARSCQRCHLKDGRGHPPENDDDSAISMFLRLSIPPQTEAEKKAIAKSALSHIPEPTYGTQLQDFAVPGLKAEGQMSIRYEEIPVILDDGTRVFLRKPAYSVKDLAYGPLHNEVLLSPRVAPQMIGLGLLGAIHEDDLLANADPQDKDKDGISGRISWVGEEGGRKIGRFGWKASTPTVREQSAGAFAGDIGISSPDAPRHWGDCTERQKNCLEQPTGVQKNLGDTEAPDPIMDLVAFYSRNLAVPQRRDVSDRVVLKGKEIFYSLGCVNCHRPKYVTNRKAIDKEHRFQLIWPYSDLLLHDMGDGLADNRPVGSTTGREWRTAPLWGIGLTKTVNGHTYFLHDGRARNLTEAILWHGGEGQASRDGFAGLSSADRGALIRFLESL